MRIHVALALLVLSALSGCTSGEGDGEADLLAADDAAPPVLYLNVTIGNETHRYTSAGGHAGHGSASASATAAANGTSAANATSSGPGGNATGNATGSGASDGPVGLAPLDVTVQAGASGLPAGAVSWELDFGEGGNATNGTASGTQLPASANHTYEEPGTYNVTLSLRVANGTAQTLRASVVVEEDSEATAFGPVPDPIVIEGTASGLLGEGAQEHTFELPVPVAMMTITLEYSEVTGAAPADQDLDWTIVGPGGEEDGGENFGPEEPVTFEEPTPGTWTVTVSPFTALECSYTVTVTFA